MKNVILTGFMGVGKSTIGREAARMLGFRFVDIDRMIVKAAGKSIPDIFEQDGEARFREMEAECVREAAGLAHCVIATGGGAVMKQENMDCLMQSGIVVYLEASAETLLRRIGNGKNRPLALRQDAEQIRARFEARRPYYARCHYRVSADESSPMVIAKQVVSLYRSHY